MTQIKQRIGLYGGSFDPVHLGHLLVAQAAREELALDQVHFIPAAQSPFKPHRQLAPDGERLRMLRLALAGKYWCTVDPQEIERGGISYTIDTVREIQSRLPSAELFYLIGSDHVSQLEKWREVHALAAIVRFVLIPRPGEHSATPPSFIRIQALNGFPLGVSSSQIRERVHLNQPIELLTGQLVAEAIRNNGLYL
jgi:nicotinate-nucleotide adenylyltransferase